MWVGVTQHGAGGLPAWAGELSPAKERPSLLKTIVTVRRLRGDALVSHSCGLGRSAPLGPRSLLGWPPSPL